MPLDSMLAENFHAAYRQKRSGVLTAEGATLTMRFCFQDGSPIAIDLGDAKDRLLAYTLRSYNRLTEDQMADVLHHWGQGQASVADLVVARSYASEEEVGRSTQAMVEDSLCKFFASKVAQVSFDDQKTIDGFDFDRQAFRLKIDAEILLRTVDARVAEIRTVEQEFGSYDAVFAFNEDSPGSGNLTEAERQVLNHLDGQRDVHAIAELFRDSDVNTARVLAQLAAKKIIRRLDGEVNAAPIGSTTGMRQAIGQALAPTAGNSAARAAVAAAAMRSATPTMRDFTPYRQVAEEPRSRFMTVVLVLVLALLCAVGVLVYQYQQRKAEFQAAVQRLEEAITRSAWSDARQQIDDARAKAGKDLSAVQQVDVMDQRLRAAADVELAAIAKLSTEGDHQQAGIRLSRMYADDKVDALRSQVARNEAASRRRAQDLADRASLALDQDDAKSAASLIEMSPLIDREKGLANEAVERWRVAKLELAAGTTTSYSKRVAALTKLRNSAPAQRTLDQMAPVEADVKRQEQKLREQVAGLRQRIDKGDLDGVASELDKGGLPAQVEDTPLATELAAVRARITEVRATVDGMLKSTADALISIEHPERLTAASAEVSKLTTSTIPGVAPKAVSAVALLGEVSKIPSDQAPDTQAAALQPLIEQPDLDAVLVDALRRRIERMRGLEGVAAATLDAARALARDGHLEDAVKNLDDLIARPELRMTVARDTSIQEVDELKARLLRRGQLKDQLKAAIARGDVAAGTTLAREMGLKYLPLSIESLPSGAEVWHDGKQIGTTPMVLDITAAERVDYAFDLKVPGYLPASASGAQAEAGWRLLVKLERQPVAVVSLGGLVTNHPVVLGERLFVASRSAVGILDGTGKATWKPFDKNSIDSPLYAPAAQFGDEILLGTRDQVAISLAEAGIQRVPLAGRTDFAVAIHKSALIVDRRYLIIAGLDGALHATDDRDPQVAWKGPSGSPFLTGPRVIGDVVVAVRKDGTIERLQADDGGTLSGESLELPVVAAWATPTGVAGYTANELFEYDGEALHRTALPQPVVNGAQDLVITALSRVLVRSTTGDKAWDDVGKLEDRLTGTPVVWKGHAVLPLGSTLMVYGPRGFRLTSKSEFLSPVVRKDHLLVVTQDGQVQEFEP